MARLPLEVRKSKLVEAAITVMIRDGVAAATVRAIVAEAKMPLASFTYCFRSRDEMIREVVHNLGDRETDAAVTPVRSGVTVLEALHQAFEGYLALLLQEPGLQLIQRELAHVSMRSPELADLAPALYEQNFASATAVLETVSAQTGTRWTMDIASLSRLVVMITDGITSAWLADRDIDAARAAVEPAIAFLAGMAEAVDD